ncbi:exonuclease [Candidatus Woesearchaeota archaeon CG10_big_fil_rev_8_21_14_0_10_34_8]|nr:MAG: exonuclease [Candidatus Woesearchaeota archaeon CG10_big_fil_rev_8_21_14_0_10_34_8]
MIKNSFIFLDKISHRTEQSLWQQNIHTWDNFIEKKQIKGISNTRKIFYDQKINHAKQAVIEDNAEFFAKHFPNSEHWRLYNYFKDQVCFLDIETSGYYGDITVIGIYDGKDTKTMVKGKNLDPCLLKNLLSQYKMIITFNGSSFDLPVIKRYYPNSVPNVLHLDLRHPLAKLGFSGGLKRIEKQLGIKRAEEVSNVNGADAVYLWQQYRATGNEKYINLLVQYNEEDIINLKPLADFVYAKMKKNLNQFFE